ncbi:nuclear localization protein [Cladophialophora carrionii]|uniref:Nuclear localization protein n=1 Tax=Cladophialophora carrionii TaxID=86049 RepID=A0A1C1CT66_9EURO|nr:nuclear localization protein [Cladophialophora carrionii]
MSIYPPTRQPTNVLNGVGAMSDGSGTINPAALNASGGLIQPSTESGPRGVKRSRSPEQYGEYHQGDDDGPRKRGRPAKTPRASADFTSHIDALLTPSSQTSPDQNQTPVIQGGSQPPALTPTQTSPPRTIPKSTIKALPTVRDHTSDVLKPEGDEYQPREVDEAGEKKVDHLGYLQGGREYKIRTFVLPGRGQKLFMLATECARQLQYRDSYLLFNKNRSLFKIIASVKEKEELVNREILPYSYRSRQIAVVTARSMFRQFGSRVIKDGRRVRDDYWEAKAIKQGFTEQDAAGEKRPGAARAREAAAQDQLNARAHVAASYGDIVYSNGPGYGTVQPPALQSGIASTMAQLASFDPAYESRYKDIVRPRHELAGPPYQDLTRSSSDAELTSQAAHAAEYSKTINQQNRYRRGIVEDYWRRPHEPPVSTPPPVEAEVATTNHPFSSPRFPSSDVPSTQPNTMSHSAQALQAPMHPPPFTHQQPPIQSPVRQPSLQQYTTRDSSQFPPQHPGHPRSSSSLSISQPAPPQQPMAFGSGGFSPHAMNQQQQQPQPQQQQQQQQQQPSWGAPPPQPHPSPGIHRMTTPHFSPSLAQGQIPSPLPGGAHASPPQHPQQMQPPHMPMLHHQGSAGGLGGQQLYGPGAGLQAMSAAGYGALAMGGGQRGMYQMGGQSQYMSNQQHGQGWPPGAQSQGQAGGQWNQGFQ